LVVVGGGPAGFFFKRGPLKPNFHYGFKRQAKKPTGSENKKIAPSQTRHKNATEAGKFDREVAEAKHGGVAPGRHLFKDSASCAPSMLCCGGHRFYSPTEIKERKTAVAG
jgi:hypothetical protein